jgi:hypothetical protein
MRTKVRHAREIPVAISGLQNLKLYLLHFPFLFFFLSLSLFSLFLSLPLFLFFTSSGPPALVARLNIIFGLKKKKDSDRNSSTRSRSNDIRGAVAATAVFVVVMVVIAVPSERRQSTTYGVLTSGNTPVTYLK